MGDTMEKLLIYAGAILPIAGVLVLVYFIFLSMPEDDRP